jgi:hypothetical protein
VTVSCGSAGSCAAGGYYADADLQDSQGFVAAEKNGVWGKAVTFPGGDGSVDSLFCASAGNCLAGGTQGAEYFSSFHGFVAEERNGHWGKTTGMPGLAALNKGGAADVSAVSCTSPGNCAAGGYYTGAISQQGWVAVERDGVWGTAAAVPGLVALNKGRNAQVNGLSCTSAGSCVAGGSYTDKNRSTHGFVAVERNGHWGTATGVPGLAALARRGGQTQVQAVSCTPAGRCALGGSYTGRSGHRQGFTDTERNSVWGTPVPVPGLAALNKGGAAGVGALSCPPPGTCAAGGAYTDRSGHLQGWVTQGQISPLRPAPRPAARDTHRRQHRQK